jgi:MFS family permease
MGVSVFTDTFIEVLGVTRIQLTTAYLIGTGLSGFFISYGGRLFDILGARKFIVIAGLLYGFALIYLSQLDRVLEFTGLSLFALSATLITSTGFLGIRLLGQGMVTLGSRSMLSKWWNLRRGRIVSYSGLFVAFSFSLAPRVLDWEIQLLGWRGALFCNGLIMIFVLTSMGWLFFRDNPEECGLEMDGGWRPKSVRENPDTILAKEFTKKEAMRTYSFWILTLMTGFHGLFSTAYTFHVIDLARAFVVPREDMLNIFIYSSIASLVVNLVVGYLADMFRLRYIIFAFGLFGVVFASSVKLLPTDYGYWGVVVGMGCSWGAFPILSSIGYVRYFGRKNLGAINGASMAWMVWGSALGPLFFSLSKDFFGGYEPALYISAGCYLILAIAGYFARNPSSVDRQAKLS